MLTASRPSRRSSSSRSGCRPSPATIAPYRRFGGLHCLSDFHVVPNTFEGRKQAVETVILKIPEKERQKGKEINAMLKATRDTQWQQWLAVIDFLRDRRPDPATMRRLSRTRSPFSPWEKVPRSGG